MRQLVLTEANEHVEKIGCFPEMDKMIHSDMFIWGNLSDVYLIRKIGESTLMIIMKL